MKGGNTSYDNPQLEVKQVDGNVPKKVSISKSDTNKKCVNSSGSMFQSNSLIRVHSDSEYDQGFASAGGTKYGNASSLERLDEVGPLINEFQRRKASWTKSTGPWWKGSKNKMDFGDLGYFWPGCNKLSYSLREGIDKIETGEYKADASLRSASERQHRSVAGIIRTYLNETTLLFAQLPQGYIEKEELKVPDAPQDPPIWQWSKVESSNGAPEKVMHYGINLERVFHRRHFLLRLLNGLDTKKQAIIYLNNTQSVEWLTSWLKNQGLSVNALHQSLLMAHAHWILSEFTLQKFNVLVMSNDHPRFQSSTPHFGNVGLILHYELPVAKPMYDWMRRNRVAETSIVGPVAIITFFRKNCPSDQKFKELIEANVTAS